MSIVDALRRQGVRQRRDDALRAVLPTAAGKAPIRLCPKCSGAKQIYDTKKGWIKCPQCKGKGHWPPD